MNQNVVSLQRPTGFTVLTDGDSAFFEKLLELAKECEAEHSQQATRFMMQTLLLTSFGKEPPGMRMIARFPAGLEYEFWRRALNIMYPQHDGFIGATNEGFLLRLAYEHVTSLFERSSSPAPWETYPYRCLATAVVNTTMEFLRRK